MMRLTNSDDPTKLIYALALTLALIYTCACALNGDEITLRVVIFTLMALQLYHVWYIIKE